MEEVDEFRIHYGGSLSALADVEENERKIKSNY